MDAATKQAIDNARRRRTAIPTTGRNYRAPADRPHPPEESAVPESAADPDGTGTGLFGSTGGQIADPDFLKSLSKFPELATLDGVTIHEARLGEIVLSQFMRQFVAHYHDVAKVLQFMVGLSVFGAATAADIERVCMRIIADPKFHASDAREFVCLMIRCDYAGGTPGNPSYHKLRNYARVSRTMFRQCVKLERESPKLFLPLFTDPADIATVIAILISLQAFDSLGICQGLGAVYRRFYPRHMTRAVYNKGAGNILYQPVFARSKDQYLRQKALWYHEMNNGTQQQSAGEYANEAERAYWRSRRECRL